jgi:hypothetical protein
MEGDADDGGEDFGHERQAPAQSEHSNNPRSVIVRDSGRSSNH